MAGAVERHYGAVSEVQAAARRAPGQGQVTVDAGNLGRVQCQTEVLVVAQYVGDGGAGVFRVVDLFGDFRTGNIQAVRGGHLFAIESVIAVGARGQFGGNKQLAICTASALHPLAVDQYQLRAPCFCTHIGGLPGEALAGAGKHCGLAEFDTELVQQQLLGSDHAGIGVSTLQTDLIATGDQRTGAGAQFQNETPGAVTIVDSLHRRGAGLVIRASPACYDGAELTGDFGRDTGVEVDEVVGVLTAHHRSLTQLGGDADVGITGYECLLGALIACTIGILPADAIGELRHVCDAVESDTPGAITIGCHRYLIGGRTRCAVIQHQVSGIGPSFYRDGCGIAVDTINFNRSKGWRYSQYFFFGPSQVTGAVGGDNTEIERVTLAEFLARDIDLAGLGEPGAQLGTAGVIAFQLDLAAGTPYYPALLVDALRHVPANHQHIAELGVDGVVAYGLGDRVDLTGVNQGLVAGGIVLDGGTGTIWGDVLGDAAGTIVGHLRHEPVTVLRPGLLAAGVVTDRLGDVVGVVGRRHHVGLRRLAVAGVIAHGGGLVVTVSCHQCCERGVATQARQVHTRIHCVVVTLALGEVAVFIVAVGVQHPITVDHCHLAVGGIVVAVLGGGLAGARRSGTAGLVALAVVGVQGEHALQALYAVVVEHVHQR